MVVVYKPNGEMKGTWSPSGTTYPFVLTPLQPHQSYVTVIQGLKNKWDKDYQDGHAPGIGRFLTAQGFNASTTQVNAPRSIDQIIGDSLGKEPYYIAPRGDVQIGHQLLADEYFNNVSWRGPRAAPKIRTPKDFFTKLFGAGTSNESQQTLAKMKVYRKSLLDFAMGETSRLTASLGTADKVKLDEYLSGLREAEKKADEIGKDILQCQADTTMPMNTTIYEQVIPTMYDLTFRAIQCNPSQLVTFLLGSEVDDGSVYGRGQHETSHYTENSAYPDHFRNINNWHFKQLATFVDRLKSTQEANGQNILDNTVILYGSGLGDSNDHSTEDPNAILIGKAAGQLNPGKYLQANGAPMGNLLLSLLQIMGVQRTSFGNSTGTLKGI
jgi:hypothetical protein